MRRTVSTDYESGYVAGVREVRDTGLSESGARAYTAQCPPRDEWERGYAQGLIDAATARSAK